MEVSSSAPKERAGFFRALWRAIRQLFHETAGALFLLVAYSWLMASLRLWMRGSATWLLAVCAGFALMMVIFGVNSFRSARRVR